jgi:hypothetical protein
LTLSVLSAWLDVQQRDEDSLVTFLVSNATKICTLATLVATRRTSWWSWRTRVDCEAKALGRERLLVAELLLYSCDGVHQAGR